MYSQLKIAHTSDILWHCSVFTIKYLIVNSAKAIEWQVTDSQYETTLANVSKTVDHVMDWGRWFSVLLYQDQRFQSIVVHGRSASSCMQFCQLLKTFAMLESWLQSKSPGPLLFVLYSAEVFHIATKHGVAIHAYAAIQTYTSCTASDQHIASSRLLSCVADISVQIGSVRLFVERN